MSTASLPLSGEQARKIAEVSRFGEELSALSDAAASAEFQRLNKVLTDLNTSIQGDEATVTQLQNGRADAVKQAAISGAGVADVASIDQKINAAENQVQIHREMLQHATTRHSAISSMMGARTAYRRQLEDAAFEQSEVEAIRNGDEQIINAAMQVQILLAARARRGQALCDRRGGGVPGALAELNERLQAALNPGLLANDGWTAPRTSFMHTWSFTVRPLEKRG